MKYMLLIYEDDAERVAMMDERMPTCAAYAEAFFPGFWDNRGWGFGVSMFTHRDGIAAVPGRFGWNGGFGTSWCSDPHEDLVGILMIQRFFDPIAIGMHEDFWTLAYQAIDD
jgi:CubicO group peptidase (beta-lactamase class C family)